MKPEVLNTIESMISKAEDKELTPRLKEQLLIKVREAKTPLETDKWIYRIVVGSLGLAILTCLFFTFFIFISLNNTDRGAAINMPGIFMAIGSAAVGALAGLLAPSPGRGGE
jgi:hypothetical protein